MTGAALRTEIEFIDHASVRISDGTTSVLSDPWYFGDAFHKGWNLLVELDDAAIRDLLDRVTHIWLSHEHPDHLSIPFFKRYAETIRDKGITLLFQDTRDGRVIAFMQSLGIETRALPFDARVPLAPGFEVMCHKDGILDSALSLHVGDETILNLNDCVVRTEARAQEIARLTGPVDVLLTQFSYAAWKGGRDNLAWRQLAAREKREALALQARVFAPRVVIPFASFVYFSNARNDYLNDSVNTPADLDGLTGADQELRVMRPFDRIGGPAPRGTTEEAIDYWAGRYAAIPGMPRTEYRAVPLEKLDAAFHRFRDWVGEDNAFWFMRTLQKASPIRVFQPLVVALDDLGMSVRVDLFRPDLEVTEAPAHIAMSSESLAFVFLHKFGFDTLSVNGCFEELSEGGFARAAKTIGIGTLNNNGYAISPRLLLDVRMIAAQVAGLMAVQKKIKG